VSPENQISVDVDDVACHNEAQCRCVRSSRLSPHHWPQFFLHIFPSRLVVQNTRRVLVERGKEVTVEKDLKKVNDLSGVIGST